MPHCNLACPSWVYMAYKVSSAGISYHLGYWWCRDIKVIRLWIQLGYFKKRTKLKGTILFIWQEYNMPHTIILSTEKNGNEC